MQTATQGVVRIDSRLPATERAKRNWGGQTPPNRLARRRQHRRTRIAEAQLVGTLGMALLFALWPSYWAVLLVVLGYVVPALAGAWLDTYRPIGRPRDPGRLALAIALQLDPQETK